MAYSPFKYAKNLCKQTVQVQLIIKNVVACFFFGTQYIFHALLSSGLRFIIFFEPFPTRSSDVFSILSCFLK